MGPEQGPQPGELGLGRVSPQALGLGSLVFRAGDLGLRRGLARAYMGGGPEIFEDEDPKYLGFLRRFMDGI